MMEIQKDSRYSWLVMVAAFITNIQAGLNTYGSVSVLVFVWGEMFNITADVVAWAPAILGASFFLTGPLWVVIIHKLGGWQTQLIGATITLGSALATAFSTQFWHVMLSYAIAEALGTSMMFLVSMDMVTHYFLKHRDKVYTGCMSCFSVGMLIGPSLLEYLINATSYKYAMIIIGLINCISFPIALVYWGQCGSKAEAADSRAAATGQQGKENIAYVNEQESGPDRQREEKSKDVESLDTKDINSTPDDDTEKSSEIDDEKLEVESEAEPKHPMLASHLYVLKDTTFILMLLYVMFAAFGENTFYALAVDFSVSLGILTLKQAAFGMTITGIVLVVVCVLLAFLSHWQFDRMALAVFSVLCLGISLIFVSLADSLASIYTLFVVFAISEGGFVGNLFVWVATHFEEHKYFTIRVSYVNFVVGLGSLFGPIAGGYVIKATGMRNVFYLEGAIPVIGAVIILPLWIRKKIKDCRDH